VDKQECTLVTWGEGGVASAAVILKRMCFGMLTVLYFIFTVKTLNSDFTGSG
jgi:hypothetical protein